MTNNKLIEGVCQMYHEKEERNSAIDELSELYKHDGVRIKNPLEYKEVNCAQCNKIIGWSPYFSSFDYVLYCEKCFAPIRYVSKSETG